MLRNWYGRFAIVMAMVIPALFLCGLSMAQDEMDAASRRKMAPQVYKNIRVLKNVPAGEVIPIMHKISTSLGVRCDFCHVVTNGPGGRHEGWERDDKKFKGVAR